MNRSGEVKPVDRFTMRSAGWLLAAPVVAVMARGLWIPFNEEDSGAYLDALTKNPQMADLGALAMILSALMIIPCAFALSGLVEHRSPRLSSVCRAMIVTGAMGMGIMASFGLVGSTIAGQPDRTAMVTLWDAYFNGPKSEMVFLIILIGVVGFLVLAGSMFRSGLVSRVASVLAGLGGGALLFTTGGPARGLLVVAALIALIGFGWVARSARPESRVRVPQTRLSSQTP